MFIVQRKSIRSGQVEEVTAHSPMLATNYDEAVIEFSDLVREWLQNDTSGTVIYLDVPAPGYYDESLNTILLDSGTLARYNNGHYEYYFEQIDKEF